MSLLCSRISMIVFHFLHSFPHSTAMAGVGLKFGRHLCRNNRCLHCGDHISRPCGNAGGWYCDECFLWWEAHTTYWRLWSVMQTRHSDNPAADMCPNTGLGLLVCSFLAPSMSGWVVHVAWWEPPHARNMSLSIAAKRRSEQLGLNACSNVLLRTRTDFFRNPEYIFAKSFCIITCGTLWHMVTLHGISKR